MVTVMKLYRGQPLFWWEWLRLPVLVAVAVAIAHPTALPVGVAVHLVTDFCLQSREVAVRKAERGWHLTVHALAVGALSGAVVGLWSGPTVVLVGALLGFVSHWLIDASRKFGINNRGLAIVADQAAHILALVVVTML